MGTTRLNIGAGDTHIEGFEPVDRKHGREAYPLDVADGSVEEIRASHVLEHFSHRQIKDVLADWVRALAPGGLLRIAVPDFQVIAEQYLAGAQLPVEGYVMGGHVDDDDHHGAIFDEDTLTDILSAAGLLGVSRWESEINDAAALPISLNLQAWKQPALWPRTVAVTSVPRLGFTMMRASVQAALWPLRIPVRDTEGAFWEQCLTRGIQLVLDEDAPEYILTIDYDSVFSRRDVEGLLSAAVRTPWADAIVPIQVHRMEGRQLFTLLDADDEPVTEVKREHFRPELVPIATGHFGLTLFRADALRKAPRPWLWSQPSSDGGWGEDRVDADVGFWRRWRVAGLTAYLATRVAIGHLELQVRWPDKNLSVMYQSTRGYQEDGKPEQSWR